MVRGIVPRQPAKTGRQEGRATVVRGAQSRGTSRQPKPLPHKKDMPPYAKQAGKLIVAKSSRKSSGYNPTAPERVQEILKRLDQTYPGVTCALNHKSAWELLVATILSAQ